MEENLWGGGIVTVQNIGFRVDGDVWYSLLVHDVWGVEIHLELGVFQL